ncbi:MAG TPA: hypothetical protein VE956_20425 [Nodularia sp. (in: cyanobacteria)]|nr:hypothetical protein [Nodularia sp. (in: cyanobacteria)]
MNADLIKDTNLTPTPLVTNQRGEFDHSQRRSELIWDFRPGNFAFNPKFQISNLFAQD